MPRLLLSTIGWFAEFRGYPFVRSCRTQEDMRAELRDSGWVVNDTIITNMRTLSLYNSLVTNTSVDYFKGSADKVLFPLYLPS